MSFLDIVVMACYFAAVVAIGAYFQRQKGDATDYFLGRHSIPWWAVMLSIVATETSALTVISVPGLGARGDLGFLQLAIGYLVGRVGVSIWLLPGYFKGEQSTAYERLESRFGQSTRRAASGIFMTIRALGDSVRVFATAIPLSIVTGWSIPMSVLIVSLVTLAYTWAGGIKAVIWVDVMQMGLYLVAGVAAIAIAAELADGFGAALERAGEAGKLAVFDWDLSFSKTYTFVGGLIGGALLSAASHGTDHLIVQRLLSTRSLTHARRALIGSGILVIIQFAIFLLVGTFIWAAGRAGPELAGDEIFAMFVVDSLPPGLSGLVIAGILAAAMSTVSSSLNSLASATTHDFYAAIAKTDDPNRLLSFGRWATVVWAGVLALGALAFESDQPVVELALSIASITYGSLLGVYILGGWSTTARQVDALVSVIGSAVFMIVVVLGKPGIFADLAWPWYVPLGTAVALILGFGSALMTRGRS